MMDPRPVVIVPKSVQVANMLEAAPLLVEPRAQRNGIVVIAPRGIQPSELMVACHFWPKVLAQAGVARVAVVLGVEAYALAELIVPACMLRMAEQGVKIAYFHEGHLETDQIRAWFEDRAPRRRVSTDMMVKLAQRYRLRDDARGASAALQIAESLARLDDSAAAAPPSPSAEAATVVGSARAHCPAPPKAGPDGATLVAPA